MSSDDAVGSRTATTAVFLTLLAVTLAPAILLVSAASGTFSSSVTVNSQPPTTVVDSGQSVSGQVAGSATVYVLFNASDPNGWGDLNDSSAAVTLNRTGETSRASSSCAVVSHPNLSTTRYNCSVTIWYFDGAGTWSINASIRDNSSNFANTTSATLTIGSLDGISVAQSSISFSGNPGTADVAASPNPQQINNTGNTNYATVNITGFSFTNGGSVISVSNVTMNASNSGGPGYLLTNNTPVTLTGSTLNKGNGSVQNVYFWLDIPAGIASGSYSAQSSWSVTTN